jgi:hypothetical protein
MAIIPGVVATAIQDVNVAKSMIKRAYKSCLISGSFFYFLWTIIRKLPKKIVFL